MWNVQTDGHSHSTGQWELSTAQPSPCTSSTLPLLPTSLSSGQPSWALHKSPWSLGWCDPYLFSVLKLLHFIWKISRIQAKQFILSYPLPKAELPFSFWAKHVFLLGLSFLLCGIYISAWTSLSMQMCLTSAERLLLDAALSVWWCAGRKQIFLWCTDQFTLTQQNGCYCYCFSLHTVEETQRKSRHEIDFSNKPLREQWLKWVSSRFLCHQMLLLTLWM